MAWNLRTALAAATATVVLAGCGVGTAATQDRSSSAGGTAAVATTSSSGDVPTTVEEALDGNIAVEGGDTSYDESDVVDVTLSGDAATSDSEAVTSSDGTVTISAAGTYRLSGSLTGQVVVDVEGDGVVRLVLDGADITSDTSAAIDVVDAGSVVVVLADGSTNTLADASTYADTSDEAPTGALYSTADLTIGGSGTLKVTGNFNNGIVGKDGLVITGGTIEVTSVDDGIIGKDYLVISDGTVTVDSVGDALKSDNDEDDGTGFLLVEGGTVTLTTEDQGLKASRQVLLAGGEVTVAGSTEAIESPVIVIDDGDIELHAADDGVNAATDSDETSEASGAEGGGQGGPGGSMAADGSVWLFVNGGTLEVWASGDGLDSNGSIAITGGDITVNGPTTDGNGALDANGTFTISGGTLVATGSAGMAETPDADSEQGWLAATLDGTAVAGSEVSIADESGTEIAAFTLAKDAASIVYSSADVESGASYVVTVDGVATTVTAGESTGGGFPGGQSQSGGR